MRDPDIDAQWEPPSNDRFWLWLAGFGIVGLLLLFACGLAGYVYFFGAQEPPVDDPVLVIPTAETPGAPEPVVTPSPVLAPTITTAAVDAPPTPPLTDGAVTAARVQSPPAIDGDLRDWPGAADAASSFRVYSIAGWDGSADCEAAWQLAWDATHLYIAVTVRDDTHVQTAAGNLIYRGDSVDIQFDTARAADFGAALSPDDFQITLSPGDFAGRAPSAFRFQGTTNGRILDAPGGHNVTVAAQQMNDGYTLEAAVPWTDLALTPQPDLVLGIALNANDNDTPGTAVQEVMLSHVPNRTLTDPTSWGSLTLAGP